MGGYQMTRKKKVKLNKKRVLAVVLVLGVLLGLFYLKSRQKLQVVSVIGTIDNYSYTLESNSTRLFKKYYKQLEEELEDKKIDEENYASLVAKLFVIDYYTLDNKITNKNIGGVQFIHSNLQDDFISEASNTMYKYVKSNLYGNRKQKLPEVNNVEVSEIKEIEYNNGDYVDNSGYEVIVEVGYVKDYEYPKMVTLTMIHEDIKLVIVEVK